MDIDRVKSLKRLTTLVIVVEPFLKFQLSFWITDNRIL